MQRASTLASVSFAVLVIAGILACGSGSTPTPPPIPAVPVPVTAPKVDPLVPPTETGDVIAVTMQRRAQMVAAGMTTATPIFRGTLTQGATQDFQAVLQPGKCFKIIGIGGMSVRDLDLKLFDPNGVQLQQDVATDNYPALGVESQICPTVAGAYRVQVQMYQGSGDFGVQVFQTPG
jgi:hypothetical protein